VANYVYVEPRQIYILREDGSVVQTPDSSFERPIHVITAMGPRNALKVVQYVEKPVLRFDLLVLTNENKGKRGGSRESAGPTITQEVLQAIMQYGQVHGFGGERSMGEGKYEFHDNPGSSASDYAVWAGTWIRW